MAFTLHLVGDLDGAIDFYHQSLSRKPDDPFASEMLNRALTDALNGKLFLESPNPQFNSSIRSTSVGSSIIATNRHSGNAASSMPPPAAQAPQQNNQSMNESSMMTDEGISMDSGEDVDMSVNS